VKTHPVTRLGDLIRKEELMTGEFAIGPADLLEDLRRIGNNLS
jgi:hypothetical protein